MVTFDQAHTFQFALFFDGVEEREHDVTQLPALLNRPVPGVEPLGLKLGAPDANSFMVDALGTFPAARASRWRAGSGVWTVVWTGVRLDIHFDAKGYFDVSERDVTLSRVMDRLLPNLSELPTSLGISVNRLALVVTGQSSCADGAPRPSRAVAATFFNATLGGLEERGEVADAVARANFVTTWSLRPSMEVRVNRNETGTAIVKIRDQSLESELSWQWDVNTAAPQNAPTSFGAEPIGSFFRQAEQWISERLHVLQEVR